MMTLIVGLMLSYPAWLSSHVANAHSYFHTDQRRKTLTDTRVKRKHRRRTSDCPRWLLSRMTKQQNKTLIKKKKNTQTL